MANNATATTLPGLPLEQWLAERTRHASRELTECIEVSAEKLGGVPVLKGTRISIAQILAEIGEGQSAEEVAADFDIDVGLVKKLVLGLAVCLDRPVCG